jgi:hypothetical protein
MKSLLKTQRVKQGKKKVPKLVMRKLSQVKKLQQKRMMLLRKKQMLEKKANLSNDVWELSLHRM